MTDEILKTGTTTVGVVCKDCIVFGADKRATAGNLIASKKVDKIFKIASHMALTTAGTVSDIQLMLKVIKAELSLRRIRSGRLNTAKEAANLIAGLVYGNIRKFSVIPGISHFLYGGYDKEGFNLYDIYPDGSLGLCDDFISSGSGSLFALGVLEAQYKKGMSQDDAVDLVVTSVNSALQRDSASGEGLDIVVVNSKGVKKLFTKYVDTKIR